MRKPSQKKICDPLKKRAAMWSQEFDEKTSCKSEDGRHSFCARLPSPAHGYGTAGIPKRHVANLDRPCVHERLTARTELVHGAPEDVAKVKVMETRSLTTPVSHHVPGPP